MASTEANNLIDRILKIVEESCDYHVTGSINYNFGSPYVELDGKADMLLDISSQLVKLMEEKFDKTN